MAKILKSKLSFALTLLLLFMLAVPGYAEGILRYYAIDVGQADCSLFMLPDGQNIVIDGGRRGSKKEMVEYLKSCGIKQIDLLVATHPHEDHIGGMSELFKHFKIMRIWDSGYNHGSKLQKEFYETILKLKDIPFGRPKRGHTAMYGDVLVQVLAPAKFLAGTSSAANNNSLILMLTYGDIDFLMMADAQVEEQRTIYPLPEAEILKAPHHGARNANDKNLYNQVKPEIVVLSYGRGNKYGHPHSETVELIREHNATRLDTADGTVEIWTDGKEIHYDETVVVK